MTSDLLEQEATKVWAKGEPQAINPQDANVRWKPYLGIWGKAVQHHFSDCTSSAQGAARLGWVDDAGFWESMWRGYSSATSELHEDYTHSRFILCKQRFRDYLCEAANVGNLVPFETSKPHALLDLIPQREGLYPRHVVRWLSHFIRTHSKHEYRPKLFEARTGVPMIELHQKSNWICLHWKHNEETPLFSPLRPPVMQETIDLVEGALNEFSFEEDTQLRIFGHVLANSPREWFSSVPGQANVVAALMHQVGPLLAPVVDLNLVAICCGRIVPNMLGNARIAGIALLGERFMQGNKVVQDEAVATMESLASLFSIETPRELYYACLSTGLHLPSCEAFPLDVEGSLFGPDDFMHLRDDYRD